MAATSVLDLKFGGLTSSAFDITTEKWTEKVRLSEA
jgi:hypothetical protein